MNKRKLYLMVLINVFIWGSLVYIVFIKENGADLNYLTAGRQNSLKIGKDDTTAYKLLLNYKDPFLKDVKPEIRPSLKRMGSLPDQTRFKKKENKAGASAIVIKYLGIVSNKDRLSSSVMVMLNGKSYIMKKGDVFEGLKLESISPENLILKMGKEKIVIQRS